MSDAGIGGVLNINKPRGVTSYRIVGTVKKIIDSLKVGHCGTLDPNAEGVLLVVYGSATKQQSVLMDQRKVYRVIATLGIRTDSGDITGSIIEHKPVPLITAENAQQVFKKFLGEIRQVTPAYSAVKYGGKRLYTFARQGIPTPAIPRIVTIYALELLTLNTDTLEFRVECSSGTYIRSLVQDIGDIFGCGATVQFLCREKVGPYSLETSLDGTSLETFSRSELLGASMVLKDIA